MFLIPYETCLCVTVLSDLCSLFGPAGDHCSQGAQEALLTGIHTRVEVVNFLVIPSTRPVRR